MCGISNYYLDGIEFFNFIPEETKDFPQYRPKCNIDYQAGMFLIRKIARSKLRKRGKLVCDV